MTPTLLFGCEYYPSGRISDFFLLKMYGNMSTRLYHLEDTAEQERKLLVDISALLNKGFFRIAGYASRTFWADVMLRKAFQHGVAFPWYYADRFGPRYRYDDSKHMDIQDFLSNYGKMEKTQALGLIGVEKVNALVPTTLNDALLLVRCDLLSGSITEDQHDQVLLDFQGEEWYQQTLTSYMPEFRKAASDMMLTRKEGV